MLKEPKKAEKEASFLTEAQKKEVDHRWENHKSDKSKSYKLDEVSNTLKLALESEI